MLGTREIDILNIIVQLNVTNSKQLSDKLNLTNRQISYSLRKINEELETCGLEKIIRHKNGEWIYSLRDLQKLLNTINQNKENDIDEYFESKYRIYAEIVYLFINEENQVNIDDLSLFFDMSRNTIILDLRKIKRLLEKKSCKLEYQKAEGYLIKGDELDITYLILYFINQLYNKNFLLKKFDHIFENKMEYDVLEIIQVYEQYFELRFSDNDFIKLSILLSIFLIRFNNTERRIEYLRDNISTVPEYIFIEKYFNENHIYYRNKHDLSLITLLFLSSSTISNNSNLDDTNLIKAIKEMIRLFQLKTSIEIKNSELLAHKLYFHLKPVFYRLKYNIEISGNSYELMSNDFVTSTIYDFLLTCIAPIEDYLGFSLPDEEVRLISYYFGGEIYNAASEDDYIPKRAIVVCSNGLIVASLMKQMLSDLFPEFDFVNTFPAREVESFDDNYDICFSNIPLSDVKNNYIIQPLMSDEEKSRLRINVLKDFEMTQTIRKTDSLLSIVKKYSKIVDENKLTNEIHKYLLSISSVENSPPKNLLNYIGGRIKLISKKITWKEAMYEAGHLLVDDGLATEKYIDKLVEIIGKEDNSYLFLNERIAIPHSSPEFGVLKEGCSIIISKEPIEFPHNHKVHIIIPFSLFKSDEHFYALSQLANFSKDINVQNQLIKFSIQEIKTKLFEIFSRGENDGY